MITIPTFFLFRDYVYESSDNIVLQNADSMANELINAATQIHYEGVPSKIILNLEVPKQIKNMLIAEVSSDEYYLVINLATTNGYVNHFYRSDVPIKRDTSKIQKDCYGSTATNCKLYYFDENEISPGKKNFRIQAQKDGTYIQAVS